MAGVTDPAVAGGCRGPRGVDLSGYRGRSTFITGPGKGCGKTSLLNAVLTGLRGEGECPGFLGLGFDGEGRDALTGGARPHIPARPGEIVLTSERYLRSSDARFEILDILPGAGALGRLVIVRVLRAGDVTLVGPERNELAALAMRRMREEFGVGSILADGAMNRITQVSAFEGARFVFVLRVDRTSLGRQVEVAKRLLCLAGLPVWKPSGASSGSGIFGRVGAGEADGAAVSWENGEAGARGEAAVSWENGEAVRFLRGPLTGKVAADLAAAERQAPGSSATFPRVVVEDFTKVFLDWRQLSSFAAERRLSVLRGIEFGGFTVILRNLSREDFLAAMGELPGWSTRVRIEFNPFELAKEAESA